jgi:predicted AAA+ superfamily ATPase
LLYQVRDNQNLLGELESFERAGREIMGMFARAPEYADLGGVSVPDPNEDLWTVVEAALGEYMVQGGFPEVWKMDTQEEKIEYLFRNQVTKVITEDLVLAVEFRKPELLKKFYISLLEQPGREVNMSLLSQELGINVQQIDKYLPLLEMTDLIRHADKFRPSAVRVHQGNQKFYPIDLALRNAVLRLDSDILRDPSIMGAYAETLVFNALKKMPGVLGLDYYRESQKEIDFIVHTRPYRYFPVEVKYRNKVHSQDAAGLLRFKSKFDCHVPLLVTKKRDGFGVHPEGYFQMPLGLFLLLFD